MRKSWLVFAVVAFTAFRAFAGTPSVQVESADLKGYVFRDGGDAVAFVTKWARPHSATHMVVLERTSPKGSTLTLTLSPEAAQEIFNEAEPYLMLAERGRKFSERLGIGKSMTVEIAYGKSLRVVLSSSIDKTEIEYAGETAKRILEIFDGAVEKAEGWIYFAVQASMKEIPGGTVTAPAADSVNISFPVADLSVGKFAGDFSTIKGRLKNNSGKDIETGILIVSFFDDSGRFLGSGTVYVSDFRHGSTVTIEGVTRDDVSDWALYEVRLKSSF